MNLRVRGGRIVDPSQRADYFADLWVQDSKIKGILKPEEKSPSKEDQVLEVPGMIVAPGFIDLHVHLRDPGETQKEDIASGTRAAVAGGFTSLFCMPNTSPVNDSVEVTRLIQNRAHDVGVCKVYPVGALTLGLRGEKLSPMSELQKAGCVAFSDDGRPVNDSQLMLEALKLAKKLDVCVIEHCEELSLSHEPKIHDGSVAQELNLKGIPRSAETVDLIRTLTLASETGARIHMAHLSCAASTDLVRVFKNQLPTLSAEVTPHHLALTHEAVRSQGTNAKMYPPLREESDREALCEALGSGLIDAVATDHAPHTTEDKRKPFPEAPNGVIGLETALPVLLTLVHKGVLTLSQLIAALSTNPARIMKMDAGTLKVGARADFVIFHPDEERTILSNDLKSKSVNSPFLNFPARGRVLRTFVDGRAVFPEGGA